MIIIQKLDFEVWWIWTETLRFPNGLFLSGLNINITFVFIPSFSSEESSSHRTLKAEKVGSLRRSNYEILLNSVEIKDLNNVFDWSSTFHWRAVDLKCMEINSSWCVDTIWCQISQNPISINEERCHSYCYLRRLVDIPSTSYRLENIISRQISSSRCYLVPSLSPYGIRRRRTVPRKITNFTSTEFADRIPNIFCPRAL